jgi:hypothetical protein
MARQKKHILSLILAIHILLSSVGVALHTRSCQMPEMGTSISFIVPENAACCAQKSAQDCHHSPKKRPPVNPCCAFESDFVKADFNTPISDSWQLDFQAWVTIVALPLAYQSSNLLISSQLDNLFYTDTSPPLSGRQILLQKQTFQI